MRVAAGLVILPFAAVIRVLPTLSVVAKPGVTTLSLGRFCIVAIAALELAQTVPVSLVRLAVVPSE
jgi:hypothetical protein